MIFTKRNIYDTVADLNKFDKWEKKNHKKHRCCQQINIEVSLAFIARGKVELYGW